MPNYTYRCDMCMQEFLAYHSFDESDAVEHCPDDGTQLKKVLGVNILPGWQDHYSPTVGEYVPTRTSFKDSLKRASEEATIRTGVEHNFVPVDLNDPEALGVTDEGLDSTYARAVADGRRETKRWL